MAKILSNQPQVTKLSPKLLRDLRERAIEIVLFLAAFSSVATTVGIIATLLFESIKFFQNVALHNLANSRNVAIEELSFKSLSILDYLNSIWIFLTGTTWAPGFEPPQVGVLPLITGTLVTTVVALFVAVPLGTIAAIYLSEFAPAKVREVVKPALELLAGVSYGGVRLFCFVVRHTFIADFSACFARI